MCGIAGIFNLNKKPINQEEALPFLNALSDRGPDGYGASFLEEGSIFLGHRRLSILELSDLGKQPMKFNEHLHITFNGEIYNFIELRKELEVKGYVFKTQSDTEVLLAAYHAWGLNMLQKLNGMFVFALYDEKTKKLLLARDRFGVKPLHYLFDGKRLAFASETFAFRFLNGFKREFNSAHLSIAIHDPEFLEGTGHTIFKNLYQLLPGHYMEVGVDSRAIEQKRWWVTANNLVQVPQTYEDQVEQFKEIFTDACRIRLRSDVPVASALSGGLDSSSIYCIIHKLLNEQTLTRTHASKQKAFIAWYPGTPNDERQYAEEVLKYTQGDGVYLETDHSDLVNELTRTTYRFDAIGGTPVMCASDVYKFMYQSGYKVSMDGHGADEMLYGYKQMIMDAYQTAIINGDKSGEKESFNTYCGLFFDNEKEYAKNYLLNYGNMYRSSGLKGAVKKLIGFQSGSKAGNLYQNFNGKELGDAWLLDRKANLLPTLSQDHYKGFVDGDASQRTYNMFHYTSLPANLRDFDRASMQYSVEIRSPFMDWRLVSYVFSLPVSSKIGDGFTKRILRDAMRGQMPESIRTRKLKIGLSAPLPSWFNGTLKPFIRDLVNSSEFQSQPYWNGKEIAALVRERESTGWNDFFECSRVWKYINAYLLMTNKSTS